MRMNAHMSSNFLTTHVFNSAASSSVTSISAIRAGPPWRGDGALFDDISGVEICKVLENDFGEEVYVVFHKVLMRVRDVVRRAKSSPARMTGDQHLHTYP